MKWQINSELRLVQFCIFHCFGSIVRMLTTYVLSCQNLELTHDARSARAYRDEVDILKDKAARLDKADAEIAKYKEKLNELEYFRTRVEELREDNAILVETRNMLEEQLSSSHKRIEGVIEVEQDLILQKERVAQLQQERDADRQQIQDLVAEKTKLELEKNSSLMQSANLEEELTKTKIQMHQGGLCLPVGLSLCPIITL